LLHLDVQMKQNTFQLLRQMETTVYQWVHNYSQLVRQQATTVYKWVHNHFLIKGWGVSIITIFSTGILPLGKLLQQNTPAAVLIHIHFLSHYINVVSYCFLLQLIPAIILSHSSWHKVSAGVWGWCCNHYRAGSLLIVSCSVWMSSLYNQSDILPKGSCNSGGSSELQNVVSATCTII